MDLPASPAPHNGVRLLALVVESETGLRIETADRLAEAGFEVLEAWSAATALREIARHARIRLVVVDADLPGAEARFALVHEIARHRPDLCLIALSAGPAPGPGTLPEGVRFAAKPLGPALARAVWDALEHRPEGDGRL
ncbi:response regulator [Methylorubrum populi]|jgi:DNA-binding NtrC family response regulator|uniref:Response regulator n=1 Tax=Methylorubrum rhodesianum TaxID=29427 RepID=A0ABU9ZGN4_9HYPH|nr:response regulator [Methylorubrum rhodesianum]MBK3405592.1 response regulator [Methylorubrum rhodesianum]MBY0139220.1 response regulator [Methylorubrum populi]